MKIHAVFNRDGGTFRTTDMEAYAGNAERIFSERGNTFSYDIVGGDEIEETLKRASGRDDLGAMLAGGGDGTISLAAGLCWKNGMPLGVIPAGTMNLFARALGMPLDIEAALPVLASGKVRDCDIASANGKSFIHQYSVGLHSRMVRVRNSYQFRSKFGKMRASMRAVFQTIIDPPAFDSVYRIEGAEEERRVSAISVSNNLFSDDPLLYPSTLSGGELGVYIADAMRPAGVAKLVFDILRGKLRLNEEVQARGADSVELSFPKLPKRASAVMDGELTPLERDVTVRMHAGELKILAPDENASEEEPSWFSSVAGGQTATETPSRRSS
ncbi:diacylglycerol/lipid kinase family protein [Pararhizobium mangrovi]|uniref:Diacylglycerol kinase family lipid kinase n=1 Tax=Pararhizobium mangrovi TaxID=2590452 RepID=A0A506U9W5_9HYPH|nr:diacylglycerol kinase family protein [Pararhizobium mangrovi]TPW29864.1 diacylglycerol kinase family lipid kinase [Pararhizobium mangrovi]